MLPMAEAQPVSATWVKPVLHHQKKGFASAHLLVDNVGAVCCPISTQQTFSLFHFFFFLNVAAEEDRHLHDSCELRVVSELKLCP